MPNKKRPPTANTPMYRSANLMCRAVDGQTNRYELAFSSEEPYARWGDVEVLLHEPGAVDLSRFGDVGTLLFSHGNDPNYGRVPIGRVLRAWLDETDRVCRAEIEFDEEDESCKRLKSKLDRGMLNGVSVGYSVRAWTRLEPGQRSVDGRFTGPMYLAAQWTPHEISLEPVPADPTVGLGKNFDHEEDNQMNENEMNNGIRGAAAPANQPTAEQPAVAPAVPAAPEGDARSVEPNAPNPDPIAEERTRAAGIVALCGRFGLDSTEYIRGGESLERVQTSVLEALARRPGGQPVATGARGVEIVADEVDKTRAAAVDGLLMREGLAVKNPAPGAEEFRGMSLQAIAAECLMRSGVSGANRMSRDELWKRSLTPDSAFSAIAANVADRVVLAAHEAAPTTFQYWTTKGSLTDFRPTDVYEISESGELDEIKQTGEFKEARLSDKKVAQKKLLTFGKMVTFSRQMFINDDIGMVTRTLTALTMAFQRGINKAVYGLLKDNPTMYDGNTLFSAAHKNLCTGAAPGTAAFAEARKLMRRQKDLGGKVTMNISPAYVLTSSADETTIEALLASLADPSGSNSGVANVFRNKMQMVVDAELDVDSGAQPFYFAADPRMADTVEVDYLNGVETPAVEMQADFDRLGFRYRIYGDRGITLLGYRGLVKNPGKE